jgi:hypothetical protein
LCSLIHISNSHDACSFVMAGLVPAIHAILTYSQERGCPAQGRA